MRPESAQPLVQIGNQVFAGSYQDTLGTSLFFRQADRRPPPLHDPVFGRAVKKRLSFLAATRKKLLLKRVFLKERQSGAAATKEAADVSPDVGNCEIAAAETVSPAASKDI
jgi:hypothetical protein